MNPTLKMIVKRFRIFIILALYESNLIDMLSSNA